MGEVKRMLSFAFRLAGEQIEQIVDVDRGVC
jgi:hypothetical protein